MPPRGGRHGWAAMNAGSFLNVHVRLNDLGRVFAAETGFIINRDPDPVRAPNVAFISSVRMGVGELPEGFISIVPDLVVEVVSPTDSGRDVREKVEDWLRAGVRLVWVLYPVTHTAVVYRSLENVTSLAEDDFLDGEDVVPRFSCLLGDVFA